MICPNCGNWIIEDNEDYCLECAEYQVKNGNE